MNFILSDNPFSTVEISADQNYALVKAKESYIPIEEFKKCFNALGDYIKENSNIKKLIFDKRNLKVFDQDSMVWYFVEWKAEMKKYGLSVHRKLLPDDDVFVESVKLGREKLARENPDAAFHKLDIKYSKTLEDAVAE